MDLIHKPFSANKEGVFLIPHELYHNHTEAPEINRGIVVEMACRSPAHVRAMIDGSSRREPTKQMIAGQLADMALLEPDKFKAGVSHYISPEGLDLRTKEGKQWKKDHPLDLPAIPAVHHGATITSEADIKGMIASIMRHKLARRIVENSIKQESAFAFHKPTGLLRKCRPDTRLFDRNGRPTLADLKTTFPGGTTKEAFRRHCAAMNYHIQDCFYRGTYTDLIGEEPYFIFFVVERKPPYAVRVFDIHAAGIAAARNEIDRALDQFALCKATGQWPQYPEIIETIELPSYKLTPPEPIA